MAFSVAFTSVWAVLLWLVVFYGTRSSAVPGALLSRFTTLENPYIYIWLCDANVYYENVVLYKSCIMLQAFWDHNIVLLKELWEKNALLINNLPL